MIVYCSHSSPVDMAEWFSQNWMKYPSAFPIDICRKTKEVRLYRDDISKDKTDDDDDKGNDMTSYGGEKKNSIERLALFLQNNSRKIQNSKLIHYRAILRGGLLREVSV